MNDEIQVPVIMITDDWSVDDIETEDDCDDAFAILTAQTARIEEKMDRLESENQKFSEDYRKTKAALRWKKAALQVISTKRGRINRAKQAAERAKSMEVASLKIEKMMAFMAAKYPDAVKDALRHYIAGLIK